MKRMELMANKSVEEEIIGALEAGLPDFYYTLLPVVHGRGKTQYRLSTPTWPETNFRLISDVGEQDTDTAQAVIAEIKRRFPQEGIKVFVVNGDE
jgi:hypothetical protein